MRFTKDHEWVRLEGDVATVGISKHAAEALGEVVEGNAALASAPETVNADPEGDGWFAKIRVSDASQLDALMDRAAYDAFLATL